MQASNYTSPIRLFVRKGAPAKAKCPFRLPPKGGESVQAHSPQQNARKATGECFLCGDNNCSICVVDACRPPSPLTAPALKKVHDTTRSNWTPY